MKKIMIIGVLFAGLLLAAQSVFINEFMADNDNTIEDPDEPGAYDDWFELYNAEDTAIDLSGMYLTDDLTDLTNWEIPDGITIMPGEFLIFWADDDEDQGDFHTNFKLSAGGEDLALVNDDGASIIDSYSFGEQSTDISEGRFPDGSINWVFMQTPTPGSANEVSNNPPEISNFQQTPLSPAADQEVNVSAAVADDELISAVYVRYDAGSGFQNIMMLDDGNHGDGDDEDGIFGCYIPGQSAGTMVYYFIEATDNMDAVTVFPADAPVSTIRYMSGYDAIPLYINEFMADNEGTITDPQGDYEDWIEIYNASDIAIDISGMYLADNFSNLDDWWQIPDTQPDLTTIAPDDFLVIWADEDTEDGILHADLKLSSGGEELGIFAFFGTTPIDTLTFGEQTADVSYGRFPDGSENWIMMQTPTPGSANDNSFVEENFIPAENISLNIHPNPFSTNATISFSVAARNTKDASIEIYNCKGQKVDRLQVKNYDSGINIVNWNASDFSSGIYFYRLNSGTVSITKKMLLLR